MKDFLLIERSVKSYYRIFKILNGNFVIFTHFDQVKNLILVSAEIWSKFSW